MKVLTKEEEQAHYNATIKGGTIGGVIGLTIGAAGVVGASRRYASFRALTVPFRAFLVASTGTFISVIAADRASAAYDIEHTPEKKRQVEREREREALLEANKSVYERAKEWTTDNRYPLLFGFWVASMAGSWALVNRNPYLSGSQKLVQARMYAQGGTLAALLTSFALEGNDAAKGKGRWETIKVLDPNDPEHKHIIEKRIHHERYSGEDQWREMIEAEEERINERKAAAAKAKDQEQQATKKETKSEKS
ncbi:uncharacterized protein K460DRAFT_365590 [Cucurbitaria berberidis CBS 394.84]|uniref:HIG1 domain-containing protein n=1 Tax=Cucurbitaria berberidis CBS 394.84 TaxID=1168544 RepID=A0A9P4L7U4_9PLEO|nr:uncharacterized protein K460DRAFT_365590 [Cucurbitaria berberidis CBS 394.84]KAF1844654.1 hypothetical protein K460DRAFT_365590 [Cucurbitaria berberidis CBS 394.84]